MADEKLAKLANSAKKFYCEICDYKCSRKNDFDKHLLTAKHKKLQNTAEMLTMADEKVAKVVKVENEKFICLCGKSYKHKQSLFKHQQKCNYTSPEPSITETTPPPIQDNNLILTLIQQQGEMMKMMASNIGNHNNNTTNNTTNKFNINVFLNEDCKNAINMSDFIKSIEVSLEQLDLTKTKGLEKGITKVIMDNMNKLSVYERPLHCTDVKRETLYIKDNDKWEKDKDKTKIKQIINKTQDKNFPALINWKKANPDYMEHDDKQIYYAKAMSAAGKRLDGVDDKIIKNICKETYIKEDLNTIQ